MLNHNNRTSLSFQRCPWSGLEVGFPGTAAYGRLHAETGTGI